MMTKEHMILLETTQCHSLKTLQVPIQVNAFVEVTALR